MCRLPGELLYMIQHYSRHSLFWRCISAVQLASCVMETASQPLLSVQLGDVLSWERNGNLEYITSQTPPPIIRLTIDSDGISRVERLSHTLVYSGECNDFYRSIVQHVSHVEGIEVQVKVEIETFSLKNAYLRLQGWLTASQTTRRTTRTPNMEHSRAAGSVLLYGLWLRPFLLAALPCR